MSHPGPLLADYVDGTLDPSRRAEVDAHLRTCATCRGEVALATAGANAIRALDEPAPPHDIGAAAIAEAARLAAERNPEVTPIAGRPRRRPTTSRVLAAAGAAALILLLAIVAPKLGQDSGGKSIAAAGSAGGAAYPPATGVEIQDHANYTSEALPQVVSALRTSFVAGQQDAAVPAASLPAAEGAEATRVPSLPPVGASATPALLPKAIACLNQAFTPTGTLTRVIRATYAGQPAYLGVYLIGPGAELPPTVLQLSVVSIDGCQPLGQTTARL